ncbi:beta strand repeat-containing protein, partial [Flavobacterium sp. 270]|uniref:beta strand repeat-containing protein n=1 Tax=Flavobacterium sp. 270 TaxID=2512114 RepID=UPI003977511E
ADAKKVSDLLPSGTGIKWYSASTGGTLYAGTDVLATGTYFVSQTTNGCESTRTSISVTVNTTPSAPTASAQTFCSADAKKVSDLLPSGTGIKWYNASTGGTLYAGTEVLATGTYFVSQTTSGCESTRTSVSVTVNTTPSAPASSAQTFCSADAKKVSDLLPSGTGIKWYSASTGGTLYAGTDVLATGTYFVSQTTSGCESTRTSVSVTVNTTPSAPTASAQTFCSADAKKVSDLLPSGTGIKWYNASTGGTLYAGTEVLATGTYFVSQTTSGCESTRTSVSVTVNTTPSAPASSAQTFCSADAKKVSDLLPSGTGIKWYSASTGGTLYAGTEVLATGTYFVSQTTNGCESTRTSVGVTVNTTPVKPTITANGATTLCSGESVILTSSSTTGNLWSTGETTQSITVTSSGNYNVTVTTLGCSSPVSDNTPVTVNLKPSKPVVNTVNQATCSGTTASVELSGLPVGNWTINPGNITGNTTTTTISGLLPGNTYNYTVTNSLGCESLPSSDVTISDYICAVNDTASSINGLTGGTISTVFVNDKVNGSSFLPADVSLTTSALPTGVTFNSDGTITIAPNTAAGTHTITYTICKSTNLSICDSATVEVVITAPSIDAVADALTPSVNGLTGGNTTLSLINDDTLNGVQAVIGTLPGNVSIAGSGLPTGITINADGTVKVAPNTAAGTYNIQYSICEINNTLNCDSAVSTIVVTAPSIDAVAEALTPSVNGLTGGNTTLSLINDDTLNGVQAVIGNLPGNVSIAGSGLPTGITINADGTVKVAPNTAAGTYNIQYSICEVNNTLNCDSAVSTIVVTAPSIDAVADALTPSVNGLTGGNTTLSLINDDTLNGVQAVIGTLPGNVSIAGSGLPTGITINTDGTVKVAPNTAAGTYNIQYSICEINNTLNCDSAVSTIVVTAPSIDAVADALTPSVNGLTGGNTTLSLINDDTLNGVQAVIGTLPGNVSIAGSGLP